MSFFGEKVFQQKERSFAALFLSLFQGKRK